MNYVGKINDIAKPKVTANGVPLVSASVTNQVGEIATCSLLMKPEDVDNFMQPDTEVTVTIAGDAGGGDIFRGYISGVNVSHMSGSLSAGVDLVHVHGRDLNETSSLVPGVVPGGNVDVATILFKKKNALKDEPSGAYFKFPFDEKPFTEALAEGLTEWLNSQLVSYTNGFNPSSAGDKGKVIQILKQIEDKCGKLGVPDALFKQINTYVSGILSRGASTSTIWDMLSVIAGAFDAVLVCKPDGTLAMCPNFSAIKSSGNTIPGEIIQKFDRSAQMKRSPKECLIVGSVGINAVYNNYQPNSVGKYSSDLPGLRGSLLLTAPGWCNQMGENVAKEQKEALDKLAEANVLRFAHKEKTFNIITPPCPNVMPGTSASFQPTSGLKNFDGQKVKIFEEKFDGYCYKIQHLLETNNFCTVFWFSTALEENVYQKPQSHPLFPGGKMLEWS